MATFDRHSVKHCLSGIEARRYHLLTTTAAEARTRNCRVRSRQHSHGDHMMSDPNLPQDTPATGAKRPDLSRRRFTRAGAAAPVVLGSLISTPVLATGDRPPYNCTISGQMSGNVSQKPTTPDCKVLGKSPGYWKNHSGWPSGVTRGSLPSTTCAFTAEAPAGTRFGLTSAGGSTFVDAFRYKAMGSGSSAECKVLDLGDTGFSTVTAKATLLQVLHTEGGLNDTTYKALGRAAVASLLNALAFTPTYPLSAKQVIDMFNAVYNGGTYQVNASTFWNAGQVKNYFESLYGV